MEQLLHKRTVADIPVYEYDHVTSTQDIARDLVNTRDDDEFDMIPSRMKGVISSQYQTEGRGRLDREWKVKKGSSVLVTFIVERRDNSPMVDVARLLVSTSQYLSSMAVSTGIKWPNDLMDSQGIRKCGGCLSEISSGYLLMGLGINVRESSFSDEHNESAVSLEQLGYRGTPQDALDGIINRYREIDRVGESELWSAYRDLSVTIGSNIRVITSEETYFTYAYDIAPDGALMVKAEGDEPRKIRVGDIIHVRSADD